MPVATAHHRTPIGGRLVRVGLAALLVGTLTFSGSDGVRTTDAAAAPGCTYGDVLSRYRGQGDWYRSLLDTKYRLSSASAPTDLVAANRSGASGAGSIRRIALADLTAMYRAARAYGAPFAIESAYRSYGSQVGTFNMWVRRVGYSRALLASARPGHSEHQLGTALDLKTPGAPEPWYFADWGATKTGAWLARNSWRYGWVLSYPKAKSPRATCYKYEPWHFRYVGRSIAAKIRASGLAPREWLYLKGASTGWVGGLPVPTPTPSPTQSPPPSANPSESPSASPSASPSDAPTPSPEPTVEPPTASPGETPTASPSDTATPVEPSPSVSATEPPANPPSDPPSDPPTPSPEAAGEPPAP